MQHCCLIHDSRFHIERVWWSSLKRLLYRINAEWYVNPCACLCRIDVLTDWDAISELIFSSCSLREKGVCHVDRQLIFQYKHSQDAWASCEPGPGNTKRECCIGGVCVCACMHAGERWGEERTQMHPPSSNDVFRVIANGKQLSFCLPAQQISLAGTSKSTFLKWSRLFPHWESPRLPVVGWLLEIRPHPGHKSGSSKGLWGWIWQKCQSRPNPRAGLIQGH